jgi:hypothetical protein
MRAFRIDVETDATIEPNDQDEKQRRIEFIEAVGSYVSRSVPAIQLMPAMAPVIAQGLLFLIRGFRVGREMEDVIEKALDALMAAAPTVAPPAEGAGKPGADPQTEAVKGQAALMGAQAKMAGAQTDRFRAETDRYEAQAGADIEQRRVAMETRRADLDRAADLHTAVQDVSADMQAAVLKAVQRRFIHDINSSQPIGAPTP